MVADDPAFTVQLQPEADSAAELSGAEKYVPCQE